MNFTVKARTQANKQDETTDVPDDNTDIVDLTSQPNSTQKSPPPQPKETEKQKLEKENIISYEVGPKKMKYVATKDCAGSCTNRGVCLNSTCFCDQGFAEKDCSLTYDEFLNKGIKLKTAIKVSIFAFSGAAIITLIWLICTNSNKFATDHLDFSNS